MKTTAVEYRELPEWPGYRVGDDGSIWSCKAKGGNDRVAGRFTDQWRELSQFPNSDNYQHVNLFRDGRGFIKQLSHLVLEAFVGPRPAGMEACHFPDPNPLNNRLTNLRWDTPSGNQQDRKAHGTVTKLAGATNPFSKLTDAEALEIIRRRKTGESLASIGAAFNVTAANAGRICSGHSWAHLDVERPGKKIYAKRRA